MKVAILNAIHPQASKVNWNGTPVDAYIRFLETVPSPFTYTGYEVAQDAFPASPHAHDAYIITGSPSGAYELDPWITRLRQFIRESYQLDKKLVGICFGHQILADSLGGRVEKSDKGWGLGLKTFEISTTKPWMTNPPQQCALYFAHQDQVIDLPPDAEHLGGNSFCPNALYAINNQVLGIQGHPEFTAGIMKELLASSTEKLTPAGYETAVSSVENGRPDNQLMARWIVNFLSL